MNCCNNQRHNSPHTEGYRRGSYPNTYKEFISRQEFENLIWPRQLKISRKERFSREFRDLITRNKDVNGLRKKFDSLVAKYRNLLQP